MKLLLWAVIVVAVQGSALARSKLRPEHLDIERVESTTRSDKPVKRTAEVDQPAPAAPEKPVASAGARERCQRAAELFMVGNFTDAAAIYKQVLATYGNYAPAHKGLGMIYERLKFKTMAIEEYRRYLASAPSAADTASIDARIERLGGTR